MGSPRGNRLYSGKAKMAYERARASRAVHQEEIDGYREWAARRSGKRPPLKIVVHAPTSVHLVETGPTAAAPATATTRATGDCSQALEQACVSPADAPIRMLKPLPMAEVDRFRSKFSLGQLACGFALGTAAALLALCVIDIVFL